MVAFVIGALTGAAVALLFAPATGEETRELLGQRARDGKAKLKEQRDSILTAVERGRDALTREHGEQV
jgi:gas vesicle protein